MGNGTQARLNELGLIPRQIEGLLLTHHHLDHNEEFGPLLMHTRMMGAKSLTVSNGIDLRRLGVTTKLVPKSMITSKPRR